MSAAIRGLAEEALGHREDEARAARLDLYAITNPSDTEEGWSGPTVEAVEVALRRVQLAERRLGEAAEILGVNLDEIE